MENAIDPEILSLDDIGSPPPELIKETIPTRIGIKSRLVTFDSTALAKENWPDYLAWRRTKCRPFDLEALNQTGEDFDQARILEEIDQATHEFVGELAEIGELLFANGPATFKGDLRAKLIDECGDAIFCGCWALDAWGHNKLTGLGEQTELIQLNPDSVFDRIAEAVAAVKSDSLNEYVNLCKALMVSAVDNLARAQSFAGLTSNAFKKLRFQRREQDRPDQCDRVTAALVHVNILLILASSSMADAMKSNRNKLDARFPDGYKPGVGGGIRTGAGK